MLNKGIDVRKNFLHISFKKGLYRATHSYPISRLKTEEIEPLVQSYHMKYDNCEVRIGP